MQAKVLATLALLTFTAFGIEAIAEQESSNTGSLSYARPKDSTRWLRLSKREPVEVAVYDGVSDGCWTNASATKTAVQLELKRSGFKLATEDSRFSTDINLSAIGFKMRNTTGCTVYCRGGWHKAR